MQRKFITNLALLLSLNLLVKPFWILGIDLSVQNTVGSENYGFYFSLLNFSFLFNILLDFGITNFNNRNISQNRQLLQKHFSNIILLRLLLAILYFIITFSVAFILGYDSSQLKMLLFLTFNQFLLTFILYLRSNIAALHLFRIDSFISVLDRLLMILICSVLLWGNVTSGPFQIEWFVYTQSIAYFITFFIAFFQVTRHTHFLRIQFNLPFSLMIIKQSAPYALLVLLMMLYYKVDSVMLERMLPNGRQQAGVYATAYRLLDASNNISFLFSVLLLPIFARMITLGQKVNQVVRLAVSMLATLSLTALTFAILFSPQLMEAIYPQHDYETLEVFQSRIEQSSLIFKYLMGCFVAMSVTYVFGTLLTANGSMYRLNIVAASGMLLNVALNLILIPQFESVGSAVASLITQGLTAAAQVYIAVRLFKFRPSRAYVLRFMGFVSGLLLLVVIRPEFSPLWVHNALISVAICVGWAFILGLVSVQRFVRIVRSTKEDDEA